MSVHGRANEEKYFSEMGSALVTRKNSFGWYRSRRRLVVVPAAAVGERVESFVKGGTEKVGNT